MKNRTVSIISLVVISALITAPVPAEQSCPSGKDKAGYAEKKESLKRELNLTAEQDKLLEEAKKTGRVEMEELIKALKAKREELHNALAAPGVTRQELDPIASQIKALQSQMVDRRIDGILKVKAILTPEQYQKLQAMRSEWKKNGKNRHSEKGW